MNEEQWFDIANNVYQDYEVFFNMIIYILMSGLFKMVFSSNSKLRAKTDEMSAQGEEIMNIKSSTEETYNDIKEVLKENKYLKEHIENIERREELLGDMLKGFVKASGIKIEDKLEIAKTYDKFKELALYVKENHPEEYEELPDTIKEFTDKDNELREEDKEELEELMNSMRTEEEG